MAKKNKMDGTHALGPVESIDSAEFFERVAGVIDQARKFVGRTADLTMSITYFAIGH
jgi:hypothetical protein